MQNKLLSALLVANLLSLLILVQLLPHPTTQASQQWEYKIESVPDLGWDEGMGKLGDQGWELLFARRANGSDEKMSYEMIFKRPKTGKP